MTEMPKDTPALASGRRAGGTSAGVVHSSILP